MLRLVSGLAVVGMLTGSFEAQAQCATCGNPALTAGASDLGKALGEEVVETPALTLSGSYSFTNFDKFQNAEGDRLTPLEAGLNEDYYLSLNVFVLNAEVSHPVGAALSLALPYGIAGFKNESEEGSDPGIADIEARTVRPQQAARLLVERDAAPAQRRGRRRGADGRLCRKYGPWLG